MQFTATAILITQTLAYSLCNKVIYPHSGKSVVNIPLTSSGTFQTSSGASVTFKGSVSIVDGCTFNVSDVMFNGPETASWFGGIGSVSDASASAVRLTPDVLKAGQPYTAVYTLSQNAGAWVSYDDFNQFRLFDPISGIVIAVADIPGNLVTPGAKTNPGGLPTPAAGVVVPTSSASAGSAVPTSSTQSSSTDSLSTGAIAGIAAGSAAALILSVCLGIYLYRRQTAAGSSKPAPESGSSNTILK